ncbi:MAG: rod shape-determining protein MreC [Gemmatimonadetes bacterium]|nr:rod shape-determining protein MreC [Gemmatimonadota bacterium]
MFIASVGVAVTFLLGPPQWGQATAAGIRSTALVPFLWLQARAEEARTSRARFEEVEAQRDSAAWAAQGLPGLRAENDRLRALLGIVPRVNVPYRPAEVMRQSQITDGRTLIVSEGRAVGVNAFDPVVAPEGLVGVVLTADRNTSVVMTWEHPEFRVSAATEDGGVLGTVAVAEGEEGAEAMLELRGVPYRDTVSVGTLVVTTGLGGIYPRGVPIGRVVGVAREQKGWERIYLIRPAVNLGATGHVLVLGHTPSEEAALATPAPKVVTPAAGPAAAPTRGVGDSTRPFRRRRRPVVVPTPDSGGTP